MCLPDQQEQLRFRVSASLDSVKVHTGCEVGGFELNLVKAGFVIAVYEVCYFLAKNVEHCKCYVASMGKTVADRCCWVERIRVVLG